MKKNNLFLSVITLLIFLVASCGGITDSNSSNSEGDSETTEDNNTTKEMTKEDKINYIKEKFSEIEKNLSSMERKETSYEGSVGEEEQEYYIYQEWVAFYDGNKIAKLTESSGDEGYWGDINYYYDNGKLFFIYHQLEFDGDPIEENRIYIYDGKIINALTKTTDEMDISLSEVKNKKYEEVLNGELQNMYFNWEKNAMKGYLENVEK